MLHNFLPFQVFFLIEKVVNVIAIVDFLGVAGRTCQDLVLELIAKRQGGYPSVKSESTIIEVIDITGTTGMDYTPRWLFMVLFFELIQPQGPQIALDHQQVRWSFSVF